MPEVNKQELAVMNAEMAARIFMHIAQVAPSPALNNSLSFTLTDQEQQALRDVCGACDPSLPANAPDTAAPVGKTLG